MTNKEMQESTVVNGTTNPLALAAMGLALAPIFAAASPLVGIGVGVGGNWISGNGA